MNLKPYTSSMGTLPERIVVIIAHEMGAERQTMLVPRKENATCVIFPLRTPSAPGRQGSNDGSRSRRAFGDASCFVLAISSYGPVPTGTGRVKQPEELAC